MKLLKLVLIVACAQVSCAAKVVRTMEDGTKVAMSENLFAYLEGAKVATKIADAGAACFEAIAPSTGAEITDPVLAMAREVARVAQMALCRGGDGGGRAQLQPFTPAPTIADRILQFSPLIMAGGNLWAQDRAQGRQIDASIKIEGIRSQAQVDSLGIVAGLGSSGFQALQNTSLGGYNTMLGAFQVSAQANTAAVQSLERLGSTAVNAASDTAQGFARWFAELPPTFQYDLGAGAVFGDGNNTLNGGGILDQRQGRDFDSIRTCRAELAAAAGNDQTGGVSGTTGATGGALGFTPVLSLPVSIACGD